MATEQIRRRDMEQAGGRNRRFAFEGITRGRRVEFLGGGTVHMCSGSQLGTDVERPKNEMYIE